MITARDLRRKFGPTRALDGVTFEVRAGEVVALLGPNGAGKSTLLQILAGLLRADGGRASLAGAQIPGDERTLARLVGYVPQGESVYPELTVLENLRYFGAMHGVPRARMPEATARVLDEIALADRAHARAGSLSGGQRQRLAIGASLVHDPQALLLDEPATGLDPPARARLGATLATLRARGRAVLFSTHNFHDAAAHADRALLLVRGRIAADVPASDAPRLERMLIDAEASA